MGIEKEVVEEGIKNVPIHPFLVAIGILAIYAWIGYFIYQLKKSESDSWDEGECVLYGAFWPLVGVYYVIYYLVKLLILPICAATHEDIRRLEDRIDDTTCRTCGRRCDRCECEEDEPEFKVGDIITGVSGNPDGYEHLYEGCVCRVLSINNKGIMKLLLLDHKDKQAQEAYIGDTFTAPSRNFVLIRQKKKAKARAKRRR